VTFKVIKPGYFSTIQDYGRWGYAGYGMSQSGAMDEHAYCWANKLLNNHFNDAVLEITFGGVQLIALVDTVVITTGADLNFTINNQTAPMWQNIKISNGDLLSWGMPKSGIRSYFSVKGGFDVAQSFNSKSVNLRENIGQKLMQGDELNCNAHQYSIHKMIPRHYIPNYNNHCQLRLLPTYQFDEFNSHQKKLLFNQTYRISPANDRTGCRLKGQPIILLKQSSISEGISYGCVEISNDGMPIILLKDSPTIGGYPKIGTVFSLDLALLAQQQTNAKVRFQAIDMATAQQKRAEFNIFFGIE
jgi:5-oxoprolinase (ATP-hydrolysing) subunit C